MTLPEKKKAFNRTLFAWHKGNYREMAWRDTHDPYRILISEIMLQQTQVDRVRTKYAEFVKRFPTVQALARSSLGDVLRVWSGLGYNRRARYLHECAQIVVDTYHGKFPNTYEELVRLPGIGRSTAGALLAFSFGEDTPMIDTNIRRILCRVFFKKKIPSDKELYAFATTLIPKGRGRAWNYAMLDLGATLCTARNHASACPMRALHGPVDDFVYKKPPQQFAHSDRYYRGKIMRALLSGTTTSATLGKMLQLDSARLRTLLDTLTKDGLIRAQSGRVSLP